MTAALSGPFGSFSYTPSTGAWWWSDELFRIHGFEPGDVVPTTELLVAHKHPEDAELALKVIETTLATGSKFSLWHRVVDAQRRIRHVVSVGEGILDASGDLAEVRGYMIDVTSVHRAECAREVDEAVRRSAESRATIEQAKGVLMASLGVTDDEAFAVLRTRSQHANIKVRELAQQLVTNLQQAQRPVPELAAAVEQILFPDSDAERIDQASRL